MKKYAGWVLMIICAIWFLSGCASMSAASKKFTPQQKANMGIFADQTITMLSEADFGFSRDESVYTREFFSAVAESDLPVKQGMAEAAWFFGEIVDYSVGLVTIVEANNDEASRVKAYQEFMSGFNADMLQKLEFEVDHYNGVIEEIGREKEFLGALRKGQPIINAAGRYMHLVLDQLEVDIEALVQDLEQEIDAEYKDVIQYQEALEEEKYTILRSIALLYLAYKGESDAFEKLVAEGSIRRKELIPTNEPTVDELETVGEHLRIRLDALHLIEQEIKQDWDNYRATHQELDRLHGKAIEQNGRARLITLVWLRAHQKMASGVTSPAEWFDISNLPGHLFKLGTKAVF